MKASVVAAIRPAILSAMSRCGESALAAGSHALDIIYPRLCGGCGGVPEGRGMHLCWDCLREAVFVRDPFCSRCGDPVDGAVHHAFNCSWCRRTRPSFVLARSAVRFCGSMKQVMHAFKYQRACHLAGDLGGLLAGCVRAHYAGVPFDAVAYVPLHPRKGRERSYNQSRLLAVSAARKLGLPVENRCLRRVRITTTQTRLSAEERKANVRGAFSALSPEWIDGRRILLVDDVMTTGATVNECARVLVEAGACCVYVATVARG